MVTSGIRAWFRGHGLFIRGSTSQNINELERVAGQLWEIRGSSESKGLDMIKKIVKQSASCM
jgi:hypothetical protein